LERAAKLAHDNLIVLDMHGEYTPLSSLPSEKPVATGVRIAGPGDLRGATEDKALFLPFWLLNREEMLAMLLDRSDQNAPNQAARFTHHVQQLKREALVESGHKDVAETFTVDSPVPYDLAKLIELLKADDIERIETGSKTGRGGPYNGKLTRFILRLEAKFQDRRLGFMFGEPAIAAGYDWMADTMKKLLCSPADQPGVKIIDFSEVPSDVLPIVAAVLARTLYDVQFWMDPAKRTPLCLVCDEAHLYLPVKEESGAAERRAVDVFERIAKEGRKYGVALLVVSQRPADVSRTILSQCNNFIAMRLTNDRDQHVVHRLMPDSLAGLTGALPLLDVGEALVLGDALLLPTRIKFDKPQVEPASATRDFWTEWGTRCPDEQAIGDAVEAFRKQLRIGRAP
jgi:DNA helicase HerA-like ATPase